MSNITDILYHDVLREIFSYLDVRNLNRVALVCKTFYNSSYDEITSRTKHITFTGYNTTSIDVKNGFEITPPYYHISRMLYVIPRFGSVLTCISIAGTKCKQTNHLFDLIYAFCPSLKELHLYSIYISKHLYNTKLIFILDRINKLGLHLCKWDRYLDRELLFKLSAVSIADNFSKIELYLRMFNMYSKNLTNIRIKIIDNHIIYPRMSDLMLSLTHLDIYIPKSKYNILNAFYRANGNNSIISLIVRFSFLDLLLINDLYRWKHLETLKLFSNDKIDLSYSYLLYCLKNPYLLYCLKNMQKLKHLEIGILDDFDDNKYYYKHLQEELGLHTLILRNYETIVKCTKSRTIIEPVVCKEWHLY